MQNSFTTQPELFMVASDLDSPILNSLDDTEAGLKLRTYYPLFTLPRQVDLAILY